jgi:hypothetical protein
VRFGGGTLLASCRSWSASPRFAGGSPPPWHTCWGRRSTPSPPPPAPRPPDPAAPPLVRAASFLDGDTLRVSPSTTPRLASPAPRTPPLPPPPPSSPPAPPDCACRQEQRPCQRRPQQRGECAAGEFDNYLASVRSVINLFARPWTAVFGSKD